VWTWLRDDHVVGTSPEIARYFLRCQSCQRIYRHYWGCVTAAEARAGERVGCKCGTMKAGITVIPEWQAALFVSACFIWRKLIRKKLYWDPRMPARRVALDA
jgi:hypothetical protein